MTLEPTPSMSHDHASDCSAATPSDTPRVERRTERHHKDRQRALDLLFEADQRARAGERIDVLTLLGRRIAGQDGLKPMRDYAATIVEGVTEHAGRIDEIIAANSHGWTLDRMPAVDRSILRIGVWEILWNPDVPDANAVKGAVDLAADLSTDDSPAFVNGLLGQVQRLAPSLRDAADPAEDDAHAAADPEPASTADPRDAEATGAAQE